MLASQNGGRPNYKGVENVLENTKTDVKIFGKPSTRPYRRMAVVLCNDDVKTPVDEIKLKAIHLAQKIEVLHT